MKGKELRTNTTFKFLPFCRSRNIAKYSKLANRQLQKCLSQLLFSILFKRCCWEAFVNTGGPTRVGPTYSSYLPDKITTENNSMEQLEYSFVMKYILTCKYHFYNPAQKFKMALFAHYIKSNLCNSLTLEMRCFIIYFMFISHQIKFLYGIPYVLIELKFNICSFNSISAMPMLKLRLEFAIFFMLIYC